MAAEIIQPRDSARIFLDGESAAMIFRGTRDTAPDAAEILILAAIPSL